MEETTKKKIEDLIKDHNKGYKNKSEPNIIRSLDIGQVRLHVLSFLGADDRWHTNYVTEYKGDCRPFSRLEDTVPVINKGLGLMNMLIDNPRVLILGVLAVILTVVISYLAVIEKIESSTLVSFTLAIAGYLAGKGDSKFK